MKHKILVVLEKIEEEEYMARAEAVKVTAIGDTPEEAIENLRDSINEMVKEFGSELVFKNLDETIDYRLVEVGN